MGIINRYTDGSKLQILFQLILLWEIDIILYRWLFRQLEVILLKT